MVIASVKRSATEAACRANAVYNRWRLGKDTCPFPFAFTWLEKRSGGKKICNFSPAQLAKEVATLDLLSGGRFEPGIGAGWHRPEYEQIGLPFESAGIRISRLEEALIIIKQFFTQEAVTFTGKHYCVTNLKAFPKPLQQPYPPIFMAGGGKKVLTLAGREAGIVSLHVKVNDDGLETGSKRQSVAFAKAGGQE